MEPDKRTGNDAHLGGAGKGFYIRTFTGKKFYWTDIEDNEFDIRDIAHSLSMNCRWTGHVKSFFSVAQHCYLASMMLPPHLALPGLLHDASEAYMHDTPSPLKWFLKEKGFTAFSDLEQRIDKAIFKAFGCDWPRDPLVKEIDLRLLATENRDLMPGGEERMFMIEPFTWNIEPLSPANAEKLYLHRFDTLTHNRFKRYA